MPQSNNSWTNLKWWIMTLGSIWLDLIIEWKSGVKIEIGQGCRSRFCVVHLERGQCICNLGVQK